MHRSTVKNANPHICGSNKKVQTADGALLTIAGIGSINLDPIGKLEDVLHVPKLFINLLSLQKIASLFIQD